MAERSSYNVLPDHLEDEFKKAKKLEWITLAYLASVIVLMVMFMGSSQAMKTALIEDILSTIPAISFLICASFYSRKPNRTFPYGYHRVYNVGAFISSMALTFLGLYMCYDSAHALIGQHHPTMGLITIFNQTLWEGWLMMILLTYSFIPALILGYKKLPLAKKLHNKVLFIDSKAQKADYSTAIAAIAGIALVGFGYWWADSLAALFISFSVAKDGIIRLSVSTKDILDNRPETIESEEEYPVLDDIRQAIKAHDWIKDGKIRFREHGQLFYGEVFVIPNTEDDLLSKMKDLRLEILDQDWKIHDFTISVGHEYPESWGEL